MDLNILVNVIGIVSIVGTTIGAIYHTTARSDQISLRIDQTIRDSIQLRRDMDAKFEKINQEILELIKKLK